MLPARQQQTTERIKRYMKSYDYEACAYDCALYCSGCLPEGITTDSEEVSPIFAGSEHDGYPVCDHCGAVHDYVSLTTDGILIECDRQSLERFYMPASEFMNADQGSWMADIMDSFASDAGEDYTDEERQQDADSQAGWYWWCCFTGCMPEGDAIGPFKTEIEAATNALSL